MENIKSLDCSLSAKTEISAPNNIQDKDTAAKLQFCKDFESVFLERLMEEMKNTIGDWGFESDGASKQVQGIFWMNLARDTGAKGGVGLWKEIYNQLGSNQLPVQQKQDMDIKI